MTDRINTNDFNRGEKEKIFFLRRSQIYEYKAFDLFRNFDRTYIHVAYYLKKFPHTQECNGCLIGRITDMHQLINPLNDDHDYTFSIIKYRDWIEKAIGFENLGIESKETPYKEEEHNGRV